MVFSLVDNNGSESDKVRIKPNTKYGILFSGDV